MSLIRDLKQNITNGLEDIGKVTKLGAKDISEKIQHEVNKEKLNSAVEDLKEDYNRVKSSIKNTFK